MKLHSPSQENSDDKIIWQQFLSGNVTAFEKLMSIHFRTLFHYGCKFSRDHEFVKDSIQDLFMHLWEKRERLNADAAVKPYLMASLRRLMHRSASSKSWVGEGTSENAGEIFDLEFSV